jgi:hypothetical protein
VPPARSSEPIDIATPKQTQITQLRSFASLDNGGVRPARVLVDGYALDAETIADGVVLAATGRAEDPGDRGLVIAAYLNGTELDSRLGRYRIGDTGEFDPVRR